MINLAFLWQPRTLILILFICYGEVAAMDSPIKSDEIVTFFPTIGYPVDEGQWWELHLHGWIYEPQWEIKLPSFFTIHPRDDQERTIFKQRLHPFLVDNERGKAIPIQIGAQQFTLNKSTPNGHFSGVIRLPAADINSLRKSEKGGNFIPFAAITRPNDSRHFTGLVQLVDSKGISVISDIDDTIKISEVNDKKTLLANTFFRPFQAVPHMATLYTDWSQQTNVTFHYVSASPWQLYPFLAEFISQQGFPAGSFHLRLFRWKDETLLNFFQSSAEHKITTISWLITNCPQRQFILVGDSGEQDPEIYANLARQYPQQIAYILIRDVTQDSRERYQKIFQSLPQLRWQIFQDASTVKIKLTDLNSSPP